MLSPNNLFVAIGLLHLFSIVIAAPPSSRLSNAARQDPAPPRSAPPSNSRQCHEFARPFVSSSSVTPKLTDTSFSFPRGTQPPDDPWFYDVPTSSPKLTIKFKGFTHDSGRSQASVLNVFGKAFLEASNPARRDKWIREPEAEQSGRVFLVVEPRQEEHGPILPFTYGVWLSAMRGLYPFARAYPFLDFSFELYGYSSLMPDVWSSTWLMGGSRMRPNYVVVT